MGKGGGGAPSTEGLEEATKQATALQRQIYEEGREDIQPWYQMGVGATGKLSDLLGISGGSVLGREDIYNELLPQYTQTQTSNAGGQAMFRTADGRILDKAQAAVEQGKFVPLAGLDRLSNQDLLHGNAGISLYSPGQSSKEVTDYEALNAAVQERMSQQQETPEGFGSLLQKFGAEQFEEDPGYQFRKDEAQKALERGMAAQGSTLGGGGFGEINPQVARALQEQSQGLASQEYGAARGRFVEDQLNTFNMLMGASGSGQQVTSQMAQGGQAYAQNVGNLQTGLAGAQYQAAQADASKPSMFGQLLGSVSPLYSSATGEGNATQMAMMALSDERAKENIEYTHMDNGHKMYNFNYIGDNKKYNGVMAQDVMADNPEAVQEIDGVLHVNYGALGVEMKEV